MMRRLLVPSVILLLLGGFLFYWFSPKQIVKRRTHSLLELLTMEPGSSAADRQLGAIRFSQLIAPQLELVVPDVEEANGLLNRTDVEIGYQTLAKSASETRFKILEITGLTVGETEATLTATVDALIDLPGYRPADGPGEATFLWEKFDNEWQLKRLEWVENAR
jgi:hypothetical protein